MSPPTQDRRGRYTIAPVWHTCCLLAMLAMGSGLSAYLRVGSTTAKHGHLPLYAIVIMFEWATFAFSLWGSNTAFVGYVARAAQNPRSLLLDIPVAVVLSVITFLLEPIIVRALGKTGWGSVAGIVPSNTLEIAAWIVMAISAGICEETIFRGYLQQQFSGWMGHVSIGVLAQAVIFGLAHAYQGWKNMALIFVLGCIYGAFALLRNGLRANMIAHAGMDILAVF
jgi:uncharacterized protein